MYSQTCLKDSINGLNFSDNLKYMKIRSKRYIYIVPFFIKVIEFREKFKLLTV